MKIRRDTTATIFKTVVVAGAMLGAPACSKKKANTTPSQPEAKQTEGQGTGTDETPVAKPDDGSTDSGGNMCADRPRGTDDDGGGGMGRGFVLA